MPELPEVETYKRYIDSTSLRQKITKFECADERLLKQPPELFEEALIGQEFTETHRIGKYLFFKTTGTKVLVMHFGMTGKPEYFADLEARPRFAHIVYHFASGYHLGYLNKRKFGWNDLTDDIQTYAEKAGLGKDARDLSFPEFEQAVRRRKTYIKPVIMDQSVAAGIGNWMADDMLYQTRIHPEKKVGDLTDDQLKALYEAMINVIEVAIDQQATYHLFPEHFFIHIRKLGATCHHTGAPIEKLTVGGRSTYYSPEWQKMGGSQAF